MKRCSCADGANVSSVWSVFIIFSLNSELPGLKIQITYFFQLAFIYIYKCPQRRGYVCITAEHRGDGTAWGLPAGGAQTTKL